MCRGGGVGIGATDRRPVDRVIRFDDVAAAEVPGIGDLGESASLIDSSGLHRGTSGNEVGVGRHVHDSAREVGDYSSIRRTARSAPNKQNPAVGCLLSEGIRCRQEVADHSFDGGTSEVRRCRVGAESRETAGRRGSIGCPLAVKVRNENEAFRPRGRFEGESVECLMIDADEPSESIRDFGGVHRADQREEATGRIGEAGHSAGCIIRRGITDREMRFRSSRSSVPGLLDVGRDLGRRPCCRPFPGPSMTPVPGHSPARHRERGLRAPVVPVPAMARRDARGRSDTGLRVGTSSPSRKRRRDP